MKKGSIKVKLNAIKQFYNIAVKLKLIENSPAKDVGVKIHEASEISPMKFLTLEQLRDLLNIIPDYDEKHIESRCAGCTAGWIYPDIVYCNHNICQPAWIK